MEMIGQRVTPRITSQAGEQQQPGNAGILLAEGQASFRERPGERFRLSGHSSVTHVFRGWTCTDRCMSRTPVALLTSGFIYAASSTHLAAASSRACFGDLTPVSAS